MMLPRLVHPSRKVASFAGAIGCAGAVIYILHNYINLGIGTLARSFGIYNSDIFLMFFAIVSLCPGVFIQSRLENGLYKGRTVRIALVIAIAATAVYILNKIFHVRVFLGMKLALVILSMIPLPHILGKGPNPIREALLIIPCLIAFAFCVPALVRGLINGLRQI